jgi:5'-3' exonuclease
MRRSMKDDRTVLVVVDFSNQVWRNHHATLKKMKPNSEGVHIGSVLGMVKTLVQAYSRFSKLGLTPKLVICEDRPPTRKRELYAKNQKVFRHYDGEVLYKGNRKKKDIDYDPIAICTEFMNCIPHTKYWCDGEEADDVIATVIYKELVKNKKRFITLYSTDRDMIQLSGRNLRIYFNGDGDGPDKEYLEKKFQTSDCDKVVLHKLIRGDAGDNVKGVYRYPWKATLDAFEACDGTVESYFYEVYKLMGADHRATNLLVEYADLILLNKKLVQLRCDLPLESEMVKSADIEKWTDLCIAFETPSIMETNLLTLY